VHARDLEAAALRPRVLGREVLHRAPEEAESSRLLESRPSTEVVTDRVQEKVADKYHGDAEYINDILKEHYAIGDAAREAGEDEDEALIENAKKMILHATSNSDLLLKAELLIGEDWLGKIEMISGNIYRIGAFAGLMDISSDGKRGRCTGLARIIGCGLVFLFQVFGPLLLFVSAAGGLGREEERRYKWENWKIWNSDSDVDMFDDWKHIATTKLLGLCFLEAFILNALFVSQDERGSEEKIWDIFGFLKRNTPNYEVHGSLYLFMGSFVNNWLVVICTLDAYMIIGASRTPSDLLLNSLALLFLFNLDDIDGDMGFVDDDDWPGDRIGWIHSEIVKAPSNEDTEETMGYKEWCNRMFNMSLYSFSFFFLSVCAVVMPILSAMTPFLLIVPDN
jgi:hypothetical protein